MEKSNHDRILVLSEGEPGTRPSWDEYGMVFAIATSTRSSCHYVRSGTAVMYDNAMIGTGYNGASSKLDNCLTLGCNKDNQGIDFEESRGSGTCIGSHSEVNALRYSRIDFSMRGNLVIYNTIFPCHTCAKHEIIPNAKRLVFKQRYSDDEFESTMDLFKRAGVEVCQLDISKDRLMDICFNQRKVKYDVWSNDQLS